MEKLRAPSSTSSSTFESVSASAAAAASISMISCRCPRRRKGSIGSPCFLEACYRCMKRMGDGRDIYMYRGDVPFCSEECRQQQIEVDEAEENKKKNKPSLKLPAKMKAKDKEKMSDKSKATEVRAVTAAVAC